jgi:hypothetical protein
MNNTYSKQERTILWVIAGLLALFVVGTIMEFLV